MSRSCIAVNSLLILQSIWPEGLKLLDLQTDGNASLSTEKRAQIISLSMMNLSHQELGSQFNVSTAAVHNGIKSWRYKSFSRIRKRQGVHSGCYQ